jgi:hypothetical protein
MRTQKLLALTLVVVLGLAACGSDDGDSNGNAASAATTDAPDRLFDNPSDDPTASTEPTDALAGTTAQTAGSAPNATQPSTAPTGSATPASEAPGDDTAPQTNSFCAALDQMAAILTPQGGSMNDLFNVTAEEKTGLQKIATEAPAEIKADVELMVEVLLEVADSPEGSQLQAFLALQTSPKGAELTKAEAAIDEYATANCD